MEPIKNKPYVWFDKTTGSSVVRSVVFCNEGYGIREVSDPPTIRQMDDTLLIIYHIIGSEMSFAELAFDLSTLSSSEYNPTIQTKVTVLLADERENILGFQTIKPRTGAFDVLGSAPFFIPYLWLQTIDSDNAIVHVAAWLPLGCSSAEQEPKDDYPSFSRTVAFKISDIKPGGFEFKFLTHYLHDENGYDPILDDIIIELVEYDAGGNERKKGTGTTHGSEGDASGND